MEQRFKAWNDGVWGHTWVLGKSQCLICKETGPTIIAGEQDLCFLCLNDFPSVPWHPTGTVRPKISTLISHLTSCLSPSIHQIEKDKDSS